ncbi:MAG: hypothetical protein AAF228_11430 [Pseudomonadota bacterium]
MTSVNLSSEFKQQAQQNEKEPVSLAAQDRVGLEFSAPVSYAPVKVKRSGKRPFTFNGMLLLKSETHHNSNSLGSPGLRIWETDNKGFVAQITIRNSSNACLPSNTVLEADTMEDLLVKLNDFDPNGRFVFPMENLENIKQHALRDTYLSYQKTADQRQKAYQNIVSQLLLQNAKNTTLRKVNS